MLSIIGGRVNLRHMRSADARWLVRAMGQGSWWRWDAPWEGRPTPDELRRVPQQVAVLARERAQPPRRMVIETKKGAPIGTVSWYWVDKGTQWLEVGVGIFEARHWGKAYGTEALTLWVTHLFETLPIRRIGLRTWSGNQRMIRLARRLGFNQEARFREAYTMGGRVYDRLAFGLLRREWERARRSWPT